MRIGLYGGSFDPVHLAHLALGELALSHLGLDELLWLPAGDPWQKRGRIEASAEHRAAMVALAIAGRPRQRLSRIELQRQGPSYTIDTVRALQADPTHAGDEWVLILGQDSYDRLPTWQGWTELLGRVTLAVAGRPQREPVGGGGAETVVSAALASTPHRVLSLPLPPSALSSTTIRDRLHRGLGITDMVPPAVARYIDQYRLYRGNAES